MLVSYRLKKNIKVLLGQSILIIILALIPISAFSDPVITNVAGNITNGQNITITGTAFGNNGPNVVLFDNFEGGSNGSPINIGENSATFGGWNNTINSPRYSNSTSVSGHFSFRADQSVHYLVYAQANLPANTRDIFMSWWLFLPAGTNYPGESDDDGINWKQAWIQGDSTTDDDLVVPTKLGGSAWYITGNDTPYMNWTTVDFVKGEWKQLMVWVKGGHQGDGEFKFWDLTDQGLYVREDDSNINTMNSDGVREKVRINGYGRRTSNCYPTFDDVYIATGPSAQARVQIGNNSSYNDCTNLAILTPQSWNGSSISAIVNQGSIPNGSAFLFVVDSDGLVSDGYPISIGDSSSELPSAPTNLVIQ